MTVVLSWFLLDEIKREKTKVHQLTKHVTLIDVAYAGSPLLLGKKHGCPNLIYLHYNWKLVSIKIKGFIIDLRQIQRSRNDVWWRLLTPPHLHVSEKKNRPMFERMHWNANQSSWRDAWFAPKTACKIYLSIPFLILSFYKYLFLAISFLLSCFEHR